MPNVAQGQFVNQLSLDAIRVGFDPFKSPSMLLNSDKYKDRLFFFNYAEAYLELLVHLRTSVIIEGGYSHSQWNRYTNTFFYDSRGYFMKFGLDFNVSEPHPNYEIDLGWRIGVNSFVENTRIKLHGNYWDTRIDETPIVDKPSSTYWGEIVLDAKHRLFRKSENKILKNIWIQASFRARFKQRDLVEGNEHDQYYFIPGYGFNTRMMPGLHFTLSYFFKIRERKIYRIHHLYDSKVLLDRSKSR